MKEKTLAILAGCAIWLAPIQAIMILVGFSIFLDTGFGVYKSYRLKQPITSRRLSDVVIKMIGYQIAILTFFAIDKYLLGEFIKSATDVEYALTKLVGIVLMSIEFFSIDESLRAFNKGRGFKYYIGRLIRVIKSGKKEYDEITKDNEDNLG